MSKSLTQFEKYEISKENTALNHTFELIQFVEKLNNNIIKYYEDSIYSYVLKKRLEKLHGKKFSEDKYISLLNNNYEGIMLFPSIGTDIKHNEFIKQIKKDLLLFTNRINYNNIKMFNIINFINKGELGLYLTYQQCVASAKELLIFEENNIIEYIDKIKKDSRIEGFDFKYQLNDFLDRLEDFYFENKDEEKYQDLKILRKHMINE